VTACRVTGGERMSYLVDLQDQVIRPATPGEVGRWLAIALANGLGAAIDVDLCQEPSYALGWHPCPLCGIDCQSSDCVCLECHRSEYFRTHGKTGEPGRSCAVCHRTAQFGSYLCEACNRSDYERACEVARQPTECMPWQQANALDEPR
jgi:hypothetical protein